MDSSDLDLHLVDYMVLEPAWVSLSPQTASWSDHTLTHSSSVCPSPTQTYRPRYVLHLPQQAASMPRTWWGLKLMIEEYEHTCSDEGPRLPALLRWHTQTPSRYTETNRGLAPLSIHFTSPSHTQLPIVICFQNMKQIKAVKHYAVVWENVPRNRKANDISIYNCLVIIIKIISSTHT